MLTKKWTPEMASKVKTYGLKQKSLVVKILNEDGNGTVDFFFKISYFNT